MIGPIRSPPGKKKGDVGEGGRDEFLMWQMFLIKMMEFLLIFVLLVL